MFVTVHLHRALTDNNGDWGRRKELTLYYRRQVRVDKALLRGTLLSLVCSLPGSNREGSYKYCFLHVVTAVY